MRRLVVARHAADTLARMSEAGLIEIVFAGIVYPHRLDRLARIEAARGLSPSPALRIAAGGCAVVEDAQRIAARLKLSNAEAKEMRVAVDAARHFPVGAGQPARALYYRLGRPAFRTGALLAYARDGGAPDDAPWPMLLDLAEASDPPVFPLGGKSLLKLGHPPGPGIGAELARLEALWIDSGFSLDRKSLLGLAKIPSKTG